MDICQAYLKAQRNGQSHLLLSYRRMVSSSAIRNKTGGKNLFPNSAELETVKVSKRPTTVVTTNGEVQTKEEEATVCVRELDLFVTIMLLEDTPAFLSHGQLCENHGYSYHRASGQKPQVIKNWSTDRMQHGELRADRCPWFSSSCFEKKNPRRTNYSSIFLYKFRIWPFFSFMYMIRIRFFGPGELIQNGLGTEQYLMSQ